MMTFWDQSTHLLFLELHETNSAVLRRLFHQTELKFHPPVFELPAPLDLDGANKRNIGRVLGTAARSRCARPFAFYSQFRN